MGVFGLINNMVVMQLRGKVAAVFFVPAAETAVIDNGSGLWDRSKLLREIAA